MILLIPKPADPLKEPEEIGRKLPEKSVKELRKEIGCGYRGDRMIYADTDFFLTLPKEKYWLKERVEKGLKEYEGKITTSILTFLELAFVAKKYNLEIVRIFASIMAICGIEDERLLKAAIYIRDYGFGVFDAFHAAHCGEESSAPIPFTTGLELRESDSKKCNSLRLAISHSPKLINASANQNSQLPELTSQQERRFLGL